MMPGGRSPLAHAGGADEMLSTVLFVAAAFLGWVAVSRLRGRAYANLPRPAAWGMALLSPALLALAVALPFLVRAGGRPSSDAVLTIVSPQPGQVVTGAPALVDVRIALRGARLAPVTTTRLSSDEGHLHLTVDGRLVSMTEGLEQEVELTPGPHLIEVDFVASDHAPFDPPVSASVAVTVEEP